MDEGVESIKKSNAVSVVASIKLRKNSLQEHVEMYFSNKEVQLMKKACGAVSREELMQRLADPPRKFRPSTNMNNSGKMTALKLTYEDTR